MGIDGKYGRVTVEKVRERPIGEDEPVFLFRALDEVLPAVLVHYYELCTEVGSPPEHLNGIRETIGRVEAWQNAHGARVPGKSQKT